MTRLLIGSARSALTTGFLVCAAILATWLAASSVDSIGVVSFLARWVHILAAIVWVGMIWFVNFIQLAAVEEADDAGRSVLLKLVAVRVGGAFRIASHATILSGLVLLLTTGYLLDRWVFKSAVYVPPLKAALLWGGTLAAVAMWAIVHIVIWPSLTTLAQGADAPVMARARARIRTFARINLVLAIPVTFVMVAAAHLY